MLARRLAEKLSLLVVYFAEGVAVVEYCSSSVVVLELLMLNSSGLPDLVLDMALVSSVLRHQVCDVFESRSSANSTRLGSILATKGLPATQFTYKVAPCCSLTDQTRVGETDLRLRCDTSVLTCLSAC